MLPIYSMVSRYFEGRPADRKPRRRAGKKIPAAAVWPLSTADSSTFIDPLEGSVIANAARSITAFILIPLIAAAWGVFFFAPIVRFVPVCQEIIVRDRNFRNFFEIEGRPSNEFIALYIQLHQGQRVAVHENVLYVTPQVALSLDIPADLREIYEADKSRYQVTCGLAKQPKKSSNVGVPKE